MPTNRPLHRHMMHLAAAWLLCTALGCQGSATVALNAEDADNTSAGAEDQSVARTPDASARVDGNSGESETVSAGQDAAAPSHDALGGDAAGPDAVANDTDSTLTDTAVADAAGPDAASADTASVDTASVDAADASTATQQPPETLAFSDLAVQPVPKNPLACRVTWKSNLPASSVVVFGTSAPTMRMRNEALVLNHDVLVLGMRGDQTYKLAVRSKTAAGTVLTSSPVQFTTAKLPSFLLPGAVKTKWSDPKESHFLVLAALHLNLPGGYNPYDFPPTAVMFDDEGQIVWYHSQNKGSNILAWMYDEGQSVLVAGGGPAVIMNMAGEVQWQGPSLAPSGPEIGPPQPETGMMHGDLRRLPNGNFLGIEFDVREGAWGDQLVERKPDGTQVWLWSTFDYLTPVTGDWMHGNSLQPLDNGATVLYSPRNLNMVYRIDRATGKILMRLGEGGDFALQAGSGDDWFALQHSAEELPGNRILIYDNGTMERGYSRAVEYQYDLATKKAKIVWQYKGEPGQPFFSPGQGSVQRLPSGDTLVSAPDWKAGFAMPASLRRVAPTGGVKWRLELPVVYDYPTVAYRAQVVTLAGLEYVAPGEEP